MPQLHLIDHHYGHVACDGRVHAIRLLDEQNAAELEWVDVGGRSVDAENAYRRHHGKGNYRLSSAKTEALWRTRTADRLLTRGFALREGGRGQRLFAGFPCY